MKVDFRPLTPTGDAALASRSGAEASPVRWQADDASPTPRPATAQSRVRGRARRRWRITPEIGLLVVGASAFTLIILLPILAIFLRVLPQGLIWQVAQRPVVLEALRLSF